MVSSRPNVYPTSGFRWLFQFFQLPDKCIQRWTSVDVMDIDITYNTLFIDYKQRSFGNPIGT